MKKLCYVVRVDKDPRSDWGASVPDLPGCVAVAKTVDGVLRRIRIAIEMHRAGLRADGVKPPRPRCKIVVSGGDRRMAPVYARVEVAA